MTMMAMTTMLVNGDVNNYDDAGDVDNDEDDDDDNSGDDDDDADNAGDTDNDDDNDDDSDDDIIKYTRYHNFVEFSK